MSVEGIEVDVFYEQEAQFFTVIAYRQDQPDGQVKIRDKHGELVGWTAFGQARKADGINGFLYMKSGPSHCSGNGAPPTLEWSTKGPPGDS